MFTFAICYRPSVCRLSVVCNTRAPYSAGWNFQQCFFAVWYLGHPLTFTENFTEIVPKEPGMVKRKWVVKYSDSKIAIFDLSKAVSRKRCKIERKLVLITIIGSCIWAFDWYQNWWLWMTFNGVMALILRYFTELVYDVVVKQLPRFQNLLLIVYEWPY